MRRVSFSIDPTPPFQLDLTVWAIRRRPKNLIDRWDGETYARVLVIRGRPVPTRIVQSGSVDALRLEIKVSAPYLPNVTRNAVTTVLERLLGVQADLRAFYCLAAEHPRLRELASRFRGLKLLDLPGVGRWTAEYVLLRGMGRVDVFPGDDIGARNNLARWLNLRKPLDYARVARVLRQWKPYAGLIYFHLLVDGLERAGHLRTGTAGATAGRARSVSEPPRAGTRSEVWK